LLKLNFNPKTQKNNAKKQKFLLKKKQKNGKIYAYLSFCSQFIQNVERKANDKNL